MPLHKGKLLASERLEAYLRRRFDKNADRSIDSRENIVIQQLLKRSLEMREVYAELLKKLPMGHMEWELVMDAVVTVAAQWNPIRMAAARHAAATLRDMNNEIARTAVRLAELVRKRSELACQHGLYADDDFDAIDLIEYGAAFGNRKHGVMFDWHIKPILHALRQRYDFRYWPTSEEVIRAISVVAAGSDVVPSNHVTAAALDSREHSAADFFRALFASLGNLVNTARLPRRFHLSDAALATIGTCALDLDPGAIAAENVKTLRQRLRRRAKR